MGLDGGAVDQDLFGRPSGLRKRVEQVDPDAFCRPADITVVEGFPRPVFWRSIDPASAGPQHIDDPADPPASVPPRLASRVRRQMRLDLRKLIVRQPKMIPIHQRFLSEAVNHMPDIMPTTLWVRTLVRLITHFPINERTARPPPDGDSPCEPLATVRLTSTHAMRSLATDAGNGSKPAKRIGFD